MHTLRVDLDDEVIIVSDLTEDEGDIKNYSHAVSLTVPNIDTTDQIFVLVNSRKPFRVQNEWPKDTDGLERVVHKQVKDENNFGLTQQLTWTNNTIKGPIYSILLINAVDQGGDPLDVTAELTFK